MSKAFTRESDDLPERPMVRASSVPAGQNYLTPDGAWRLQDELTTLIETERGKINQRMADIEQILSSATVVPPPSQPWERVAFGAIVTVREANGTESDYRIVGPAETDLDKNWISASSPIARALLKAAVGQKIKFKIPAGEQSWEVTGVSYILDERKG